MTLPPLPDRAEIAVRLRLIFPDGTPDRDKCIRGAADAAVAAFLYVGAVAGSGRWLNPVHVVRMGDGVLAASEDAARLAYGTSPQVGPERWYQENSREQVRDEVIRQGLIPNGAVVERPGVPTTSSRPRYALTAEFAALFDPALTGEALTAAADSWRVRFLSPAALARIASLKGSEAGTGGNVLVRFPSGESRLLAPGPSSVIAKAVVEDFAPRFLTEPVLLWLSESASKVATRDDAWIKRLRLRIEADKTLPDIILLDRGTSADDLLLVFVEIVASDGPVTEARAKAFLEIAAQGGFGPRHVACVTAFLDRARPEVKKTFPTLAWGSFAWFAGEPAHLLQLHADGTTLGMLRAG